MFSSFCISNRHIVQVFNKDENHVYGTFLAIPDYRLHPASKPLLKSHEGAAGEPQAIKAWSYPGRSYGHELVYPKKKAVELARLNDTPVPAMRTELMADTVKPDVKIDAPEVVAIIVAVSRPCYRNLEGAGIRNLKTAVKPQPAGHFLQPQVFAAMAVVTHWVKLRSSWKPRRFTDLTQTLACNRRFWGELKLGLGHIPSTPVPGAGGSFAVAGHRDTFFRALRSIRINDIVEVRSRDQEFQYRVVSTKIVGPKEIHVLDPTGHEMLTLVTCYPLDFVGSAPKRFIVRADCEECLPESK